MSHLIFKHYLFEMENPADLFLDQSNFNSFGNAKFSWSFFRSFYFSIDLTPYQLWETKLPTSRATTIRRVNTMPPNSVLVNGLSLQYAHFGGKGTWSYESEDAAVKLELPISQVAEELQAVIERELGRATQRMKLCLVASGFRWDVPLQPRQLSMRSDWHQDLTLAKTN